MGVALFSARCFGIFIIVSLVCIFVLSGSEAYAAFSYDGDLNGQPTYDRFWGSDIDPDCHANLIPSSDGMGVPYDVIPFHTINPAGENLQVSLNSSGTGLVDTTITLYCDFDPADAGTNIVAYDDDDGPGLLSAFTLTNGVYLYPDKTYYLVVTLYEPSDLGSGLYLVDFGGDAIFGSLNMVPALSHWGIVVMALLLMGASLVVLRKRQAL